jgi:formylglycine-generating enzyme required for sulfatase activity
VSDAGLVWREVPPGPFWMGSDPAAAYPPEPDEGPRHGVRLRPFRLARTAVTRGQYRIFAGANGRSLPGGGPADDDELPVTYVSHQDALAFCAWTGVRLPSEAEWERAARGGEERLWPWGDQLPTPARACFGRGIGNPSAVGWLPRGASAEGVLDLAGNVWEWCEDYDDPSFYADGPTYNPKNTRRPEKKPLLVMRGGSWMYGPRSLRTFSRTSFEAHYRFASGGFRCARSA